MLAGRTPLHGFLEIQPRSEPIKVSIVPTAPPQQVEDGEEANGQPVDAQRENQDAQ